MPSPKPCAICGKFVVPGVEPWDHDDCDRNYHLACVEQISLVRQLRRRLRDFAEDVANHAERPFLATDARRIVAEMDELLESLPSTPRCGQ